MRAGTILFSECTGEEWGGEWTRSGGDGEECGRGGEDRLPAGQTRLWIGHVHAPKVATFEMVIVQMHATERRSGLSRNSLLTLIHIHDLRAVDSDIQPCEVDTDVGQDGRRYRTVWIYPVLHLYLAIPEWDPFGYSWLLDMRHRSHPDG